MLRNRCCPQRAARRRAVLFVSLLVCAAGPTRSIAGQRPPVLATGFESRDAFVERNSPFGMGGFAPGLDPAGDFYYAVDHQVLHRDAAGAVTPIRSFASGTRPGLLVRPAGTERLYYTEGATTTLYVRDLRSSQETTLPAPAQAFDLDETSSGRVLFSANPNWPRAGAHNGIWTTDASTGPREIVQLSGPSGPLLVDRATDDVYYATQTYTFPSPPGSVALLRFSGARIRQALAGGPPVQESEGQVVLRGLDAAYDLARDDRGALYVSDPQAGGIQRVNPAGMLDPIPLALPDGVATLGLSFVDATAATFDAWQPDEGARLVVGIADWATYAGIREIHAARPRIDVSPQGSVPPGPFTQRIDGLAPQATAFLLVNDLPAHSAPRLLLHHLGVPVWAEIDFTIPPISVPLAVDALGNASLTLQWPGGFAWQWTTQVVALEPGVAGRIATSAPATIPLLR